MHARSLISDQQYISFKLKLLIGYLINCKIYFRNKPLEQIFVNISQPLKIMETFSSSMSKATKLGNEVINTVSSKSHCSKMFMCAHLKEDLKYSYSF